MQITRIGRSAVRVDMDVSLGVFPLSRMPPLARVEMRIWRIGWVNVSPEFGRAIGSNMNSEFLPDEHASESELCVLERARRAAVNPSVQPSTKTSRWESVELSQPLQPRPDINHVLFDFDGTLSLIRQGWPEVMVPMFVEALPRQPGETEDDVRRMVFDDIMRLNGKQTIYQMIQLTERIKERGGQPQEPLAYKHEYLRRLDLKIGSRIAGLSSRSIAPDVMLVHGARVLLEHLRALGLPLYLASGTDLSAVKREAELLEISAFFGQHIYGALDDYKQFSKKMVIDRIIAENRIDGRQLLSFGDGYVEIENTKQVGGLAVAVASDEANNGSGRVDEWKRRRLLGVGADVVVPDFRDAVGLVDYLLAR